MDLRLFFSVLWRFRVIVALGFLLAIFLTFLSIARVSIKGGTPEVSYRQQQGWTSGSTVWVTQAGFPLGRSVYDKYFETGPSGNPTVTPQFSSPTAFSGLATVYTNLVTSDGVLNIMRRLGPIDGTLQATQPTLIGNSTAILPFIQIAGTAKSTAASVGLTNRAARALIDYVQQQQNANGIALDKRIQLQVIKQAQGATLTQKRKLTTPIVVLLATVMATVGLAFLLENLRPRVRMVATAPGEGTMDPPELSGRRAG